LNPQEVLAEGGVKAERHQWAAAMKRAAGEKVLDDPKLLKRSLKREAKRKEKSAATWAQKEKEHKDARDAKQNKRQTNLKVCHASPRLPTTSQTRVALWNPSRRLRVNSAQRFNERVRWGRPY